MKFRFIEENLSGQFPAQVCCDVLEVSRSGYYCWDNAVMESFWGTLETELVNHEHYPARGAARASIFEYLEVFYNRKRLHSSLV